MEVFKDTPFEFGYLVFQVRPPRPSMVVVVKATYALGDDACALADAQAPCTGEVYFDDDPTQSLRYDSDFALLKPRGECLVVGSCHPPGGGAPEGASSVAFRVGSVSRQLAVFGDRQWVSRLLWTSLSDPAPFTAMPLRYERSFGGPGFDPNPVGVGAAPAESLEGPNHPAPNLEDPQHRVSSPRDRPAPAGFAPIPRTWPARAALAGTYDARWKATRWPWLPEDFDFAYFQSAPPEQRVAGYWRGDEEVALRNLVPGRPHVAARLPGLRARCLVELRHEGGTRLADVPLNLDTITLDGDAARVLCVWRGLLEVETEKLTEVTRVLVAHDPLDAPRTVDALRARLEALAEARRAEEAAFLPEPLPDDDLGATTVRRAGAAGEDDPLGRTTVRRDDDSLKKTTVFRPDDEADDPLRKTTAFVPGAAAPAAPPPAAPADDAEAEDAKVLAEVDAKLRAAGIDPAAERAPAAPPAPTPEDMARLRAAFEEAGVEPPDFDAKDDEPPPAPTGEGARDARKLVEERLAHGQGLAGEDLTGADLAGLDMTGVDLTGAVLAKAKLRGATLAKAKLDEAVLAYADLTGASLAGASLRRADLTGARAVDADFSGAALDRATLADARMAGASFRDATGVMAECTGADLARADFEGAKLDEADFTGATLEDARFPGASLVEATLERARAEGLVMDGADLTRLRAAGLRAEHATFRDAKACGSRWGGATLTRADFAFAELERADFTEAALERATLNGCDLRRATFREARLAGASLVKADALAGVFESADLARADLRGANLFGAEFWRARTDDARLELADVGRTKLAAED